MASSFAQSYGTYDAATGVCCAQTQQEFSDALTADICRALGSLPPFPQQPQVQPKSFREIQAEEAAASVPTPAPAPATASREVRVAAEKAAATAAWEADHAARDASGQKPCWVCRRYKDELHYHEPKRYICPVATDCFYVFDRWGSPNTAYMDYEMMAGLRQSQALKRLEADEAQKKAAFGRLIDQVTVAAAAAAPQHPKAKKASKKQTVEKFSLDQI